MLRISDMTDMLAYRAHYGWLRRLAPRAADKLERVLFEALQARRVH